METAIDTTQSLFAEFIWQLCTDDPNYREYLDLPRVLWIRHPFCVSVAHKRHGKSMQTGWPPRPRSLSQRKEKENNILFETWTSNVGKSNMGEAECEALCKDIVNVKLAHPELYTRDTTKLIKRVATTAIAHLDEDDLAQQTMYQGVDVMDDAGMEEDD